MTDNQVLVETMGNNTLIYISIVMFVIYLVLGFIRKIKNAKAPIPSVNYIEESELVDVLFKFYISSANKFIIKPTHNDEQIKQIIQEWAKLRLFR